MSEITIIANFYKSGTYIPKLLKSVAKQTFTDWDLVCIDDCSPDNDSEILAKYAKKYGISSKTTIIRNEKNLGISRSKEVGIKNATGEYLAFIDGDDWFEPTALEIMYNTAKTNNADAVIANNYQDFPLKYKRLGIFNVDDADLNKPIPTRYFLDKYYVAFFGINIFSVSYWAKLYRTSKVKSLKYNFPESKSVNMEDLLFNANLLPTLELISFVATPVYHWRWGGISTNKRNDIFTAQNGILICEKEYNNRIELLYKYDCLKNKYWLDIELRNVLFVSFTNLIGESSKRDKSEILKIINSTFDSNIYSQILNLPKENAQFASDTFISAFRNRDADQIYNICKTNYNSQAKRRIVRKFVSALYKILT